MIRVTVLSTETGRSRVFNFYVKDEDGVMDKVDSAAVVRNTYDFLQLLQKLFG